MGGREYNKYSNSCQNCLEDLMEMLGLEPEAASVKKAGTGVVVVGVVAAAAIAMRYLSTPGPSGAQSTRGKRKKRKKRKTCCSVRRNKRRNKGGRYRSRSCGGSGGSGLSWGVQCGLMLAAASFIVYRFTTSKNRVVNRMVRGLPDTCTTLLGTPVAFIYLEGKDWSAERSSAKV